MSICMDRTTPFGGYLQKKRCCIGITESVKKGTRRWKLLCSVAKTNSASGFRLHVCLVNKSSNWKDPTKLAGKRKKGCNEIWNREMSFLKQPSFPNIPPPPPPLGTPIWLEAQHHAALRGPRIILQRTPILSGPYENWVLRFDFYGAH